MYIHINWCYVFILLIFIKEKHTHILLADIDNLALFAYLFVCSFL